MHHGSCLCGKVTYEVEGELGPIMFCHCKRCQKANGTAFQAAAPVDTDKFHLLSGENDITHYESSPGVYRTFCRQCGSPLYSHRDATPEFIRLRLGTLDTPVEAKLTAHIFVSQKADWYEICDEAPQYDERP